MSANLRSNLRQATSHHRHMPLVTNPNIFLKGSAMIRDDEPADG